MLRDSGGGSEGEGGFDGVDEASLDELRQTPYLSLHDYDAIDGGFEELEAWCRDNGLSYDRHNNAGFEYRAEYVLWRPGFNQVKTVASDDDGGMYVDARPAAEARMALRHGNVLSALRILDTLLADYNTEDLPQFKLT